MKSGYSQWRFKKVRELGELRGLVETNIVLLWRTKDLILEDKDNLL